MATPPTPTSGALTVNSTTGVILSPITTALFKSANGFMAGNASDLSYSTPTLTVPAGFGITGAGALAFTAGGSNQNITLTPSGTGFVNVAPVSTGNGVFNVGTVNTSSPRATSTFWGTVAIDAVGFAPTFFARRMGTSVSAPSAVTSGQGLFTLSAGGYNGSAFADLGAGISFNATENWSVSQNGGKISFLTAANGNTGNGTRMAIENYGKLTHTPVSGSLAAWGVVGSAFSQSVATYTDSSSSGTVATAVANSFAVPTFAASSATTFTNAANLYIAGDVGAGTNVTLTNSYGLWNVGKTRLDNGIYLGGTTPGVIAGSSGGITLTANGTNQSIVATASGNGSIDLMTNSSVRIGTASGSGNTILYQTGSAVLSSGNSALVIKRTGANSSIQFNDSADAAAARILSSTTPSLSITNGAGSSAWAVFSSGTLAIGATDSQVIGAAGNMTITAGTGASRTLTLQSTTSGSTATTFLAGNAAQAVHLGGQSALATNATDGFVYIRGGAGTPTGAPTAVTGLVPLYVDTTNNKLYFYTNGAWRDAGP